MWSNVSRLAIVGSSNVYNGIQWETACLLVDSLVKELNPEVVISGGARGIDSVARLRAQAHRYELLEYLPQNARWEPNGYKERNMHIANECDALVCIRTHQSKTYGSGWTADYAESLGKKVWRVQI